MKQSELQGLKVVELRERCKTLELETKGLKSVLVQRLAAHYEAEAAKEAAKKAEEKEEAGETEKEPEDEDEIHQGTVKNWTKRGYGFIEVKTSEGDDSKPVEIFVHRNHVEMEDGEEPELRAGMQVQFKEVENSSDKEGKGGNKNGTHAEAVKCIDGSPLSWWKKCGDSDRLIWDVVHSGVIGEYRYKERYGYLLLEEEVKAPSGKTLSLCEKLHVKRRDFRSTGSKPDLRAGRKVKFKLYEDSKGFGATYVTDENEEQFTDERVNVEKGKEDLDTETRFTGRVLQFKINNHGFVAADEDLSKFGVEHKLYFTPSDIQSSESPAYLTVGMKVSFVLYKDKRGLGAKQISMPDGTDIVIPEDKKYKAYSEIMPRESISETEFKGKVTNYQWDRGFGYIKIEQTDDNKVPEEHAKELKNGAVYFHWNDIKSTDKVVGVNKDVEVKFTLYKDEKGLGAEAITKADGEPISGQEKKRNFNNNNWRRGGNNWRGRGQKRKGSWGYPSSGWKRKRGMFGVAYF